MGKRGPRKTPAAIKTLEGARDADQAQASEPKCTMPPVVPWTLSATALKMWRRIIDVTPPGLFTAMDENTLAIYCETYAELQSLKARIKKDGQFVIGSTGQLAQHPAYRLIKDRRTLLLQIGSRLGLSPGDRANLGIAPPATLPQQPAADGRQDPAPPAAKPARKTGDPGANITQFASLIGRAV